MDHSRTHPKHLALLKTLREVLKARKVTYLVLARRLNVSEVTVKRWLSGGACSLNTIFEICDTLEISFFDLVALARKEEEVEYVLSLEQENFFASNPALFGIFKLLQRGDEPGKVQKLWGLTSQRFYRAIRKLEKLGILEVLPGERVRIKVVGNVRYQHHGPLARAILRPQISQFLDQVDVILKNDDVCMHSVEVELSEAHITEFVEQIHELGAKYRASAFRDKSLLPRNKLRSVRWLLAFAPFQTDWSQYPLKD